MHKLFNQIHGVYYNRNDMCHRLPINREKHGHNFPNDICSLLYDVAFTHLEFLG